MRALRTVTLSIVFSILSLCAAAFGAATVFADTTYSCPDGLNATASTVVGSTCYAYYHTALSWSAAESACNGLSGHLARIRNSAIDSAIASIATTDVWFGASDTNANISGASEGNFFWIGDGSAFWTGGQAGSAVGGAYTNWEAGEPNNSLGNENCALKYSVDGHWNDYLCANGRHYVCDVAAIATVTESAPTPQHSGNVRPETLKKLIDAAVAHRNTEYTHPAAPLAASVLAVSALSSSSQSSSQSVSPVQRSAMSSRSSTVPVVASVVKTNLSPNQRLVATTNLNLRTDSRIDATITLVLHKGYVVTVLEVVDDDWAYVQTQSGLKGYVWRQHLTK